MEDIFKGFHNPNDQALIKAWSAENSLFIFDTNVFLNLYSYAEQTRDDFFNVLGMINDKVWIPYHVGLEYQFRRLKVIKNEKSIFNDLRKSLDKIERIFEDDIKKLSLEKRFPKLHENTDKLQKEVIKSINAYKKSVSYWDDKQPCVRSHDPIRAKINKIFKGKIGAPPASQEELDKLYEEGVLRYGNKIPPGYKDNNKTEHEDPYLFYNSLKYERRFGDLIIWKQIIDKAKDENIKNVIFITDDSKEDWWYILDSRGKKIIGPHANLQCEIFKETDIKLFYMYNTSSFLEDGKTNLEIGVHESSIIDASSHFWETKISNQLFSSEKLNNLLLLNKEYLKQFDHIKTYEIFNELFQDREKFLNEFKMIENHFNDNKLSLDDSSNMEAFKKYIEKSNINNIRSINYTDADLSKMKDLYKRLQLLRYFKPKKDDGE